MKNTEYLEPLAVQSEATAPEYVPSQRPRIMDRGFLQQVKNEADWMAEGCVNKNWVRAYQRLADAIDTIDAMVARSTHYGPTHMP